MTDRQFESGSPIDAELAEISTAVDRPTMMAKVRSAIGRVGVMVLVASSPALAQESLVPTDAQRATLNKLDPNAEFIDGNIIVASTAEAACAIVETGQGFVFANTDKPGTDLVIYGIGGGPVEEEPVAFNPDDPFGIAAMDKEIIDEASQGMLDDAAQELCVAEVDANEAVEAFNLRLVPWVALGFDLTPYLDESGVVPSGKSTEVVEALTAFAEESEIRKDAALASLEESTRRVASSKAFLDALIARAEARNS